MKYIRDIIKKIYPQKIQRPLGRWKIEICNKQMDTKIDLSNEDHCGPCGQYALTKNNELEEKKNKNYLIK
jgi:hypothetical protein